MPGRTKPSLPTSWSTCSTTQERASCVNEGWQAASNQLVRRRRPRDIPGNSSQPVPYAPHNSSSSIDAIQQLWCTAPDGLRLASEPASTGGGHSGGCVMAEAARVNIVANEVMTTGAPIEVTSSEPLDPRSAQAGITLLGERTLIRLSDDKRTATVLSGDGGDHRPGAHVLVIDELLSEQ